MTAASTEQRWFAVRTAGPRTINLARSLAEAGHEAWTPVRVTRRRLSRSKVRVEREGAMLPTFVFVRADALRDLLTCLSMPSNPHPAFSIFRHNGNIALFDGGSLSTMRLNEDKERERIERERLADLRREHRREFTPGTAVRVPTGGFAGMTGVVQEGDDRFALVSFGGRMNVKIATFLLSDDLIQGLGSDFVGAVAT